MPAVEDMDRGYEQDIVGQRGEGGTGDKGINGVLTKMNITTIAAFAEPGGKGKDEVKASLINADCEFGVVLKGPRGLPGGFRWCPSALLVGHEQPEHQRLADRPLKRGEAIELLQRGCGADACHGSLSLQAGHGLQWPGPTTVATRPRHEGRSLPIVQSRCVQLGQHLGHEHTQLLQHEFFGTVRVVPDERDVLARQ